MEVYVYITRALILADSMKKGLKETLRLERKEKREPPKMKRKKKRERRSIPNDAV